MNRAPRLTVFTATILVLLSATAAAADKKGCQSIGGMLLTNLGAIDQNTTMGPATGDLKGAVGATILGLATPDATTMVFTVQHHWVTDSGDTLAFDQATASFGQVAPGLYGVTKYVAHLKGGTGKYANLTGDLNFIGEADLGAGQLVLRYSGTVCRADKD